LSDDVDVACLLLNGRADGGWNRLKAELNRSFPSLLFQLVDSKSSTNESFFRLIAKQTLTAIEGGSLLARKPEIDLILRLARTTQISEAVDRIGYKEGNGRILIAAGRIGEVRRFLAAGKVRGKRLTSSALNKREWGWVEEAAILASVRRT
jgi:tRNA threonylcarbamoyladenosine modification (KEOPS) complex Cgi121 subunit